MSANIQVFEGKPPRVLVAVVLDQDDAAIHWEAFAPTLRGQVTGLLWDLLVVDVTAKAGPNYADWLANVVHSWPRSRVRRLSAEHVRDGLVTTFSDRRYAIRAGMEAASELFGRWHSYDALWVLRPDVLLGPDALQRAWDGKQLLRHEDAFQECVCGHRDVDHFNGSGMCRHTGDKHRCDGYVRILEAGSNLDETVLDRSLTEEAIAPMGGTLRASAEVEEMQQAPSAPEELAETS